ncbi:MAG: NADH-quinone oxidoreductase subunit NuoG [Desulfobaccales bacterium]
MPKLTIDNREIEVPEGTNVLEAAERLGIMVPRFCYHPALGSVGACRMCAVTFLEGRVKGVEMSCMVAAEEGMVVSTTHPDAMDYRKYVIEWLMLDHPLDCPVCDEGGHCLLQDETVSGGHGIRRFLGPKRTYEDQDLGWFVQHEMNRCIQCWRCRRFYQEYAGYRDLGALQIGRRTYFGRFGDGALESPFAGNLIDVCPTGVFTDKPSRFKGRRWDFERGPSLCLNCSLGCNTAASARFREIVRLEGRPNEMVNGYFICDRGRYGFAYADHPERPRRARWEGGEVSWGEATLAAAMELARISREHGPEAVAGVGGTRSSLETQGALKLFCRRQGWRDPQFFWDPGLERKVRAAVGRLDGRLAVSMGELGEADFIVVAGADPVNEAPMLALALRQAQRRGAQIAVLDPRPVFLPCEFEHLAVPPGQIEAALGALVKGALSAEAAAGLTEAAGKFYAARPDRYAGDAAVAGRLAGLAEALQKSRKPVVVCGTDIVRETTPACAADSALLLKETGKEAGLFYLLPGANAFGAALFLTPDQADAANGPGGQRPGGPAGPGTPALSGEAILEGIEQGRVKALVLVESDPFWSYYDEERLARALERLELLVVLDYLPSPSVKRAYVALPTVPVFERTAGWFVNQEGRAQAALPVHFGGTPLALISPAVHPPRTFLDYVPGGEPRPPAEIFQELTWAMSGGQDPAVVDLWAWLGRQNPILTQMGSLTDHPERVRLLPAARVEGDFAALPSPAPEPGPDQLELLLVDWTFGTEELASYAAILHEAEAAPVLLIHPGAAAKAGLSDGDGAVLHLAKGPLGVVVKLAENMAPGVVVLPRHRRLDWRKLTETSVYLTFDQIERERG